MAKPAVEGRKQMKPKIYMKIALRLRYVPLSVELSITKHRQADKHIIELP
jgi:hypothetical protein